MKISQLIKRLNEFLDRNGDLEVQIVHYRYYPGGNRGLSDTGSGYSREWLGTVGTVTLSEYPNQVEIQATK